MKKHHQNMCGGNCQRTPFLFGQNQQKRAEQKKNADNINVCVSYKPPPSGGKSKNRGQRDTQIN